MLVLDEPDSELWERFQSGTVTLKEIQSNALLQRWWRAATAGVRADGPAHSLGVEGADLVERRARFDAQCGSATHVLEPIAPELVARGLLVVLADPDGCILHTRGGGSFAQRAAASALAEGTFWSESVRGTNGIGTPLAERRPVAVIGRAHYERVNHGLFCYGSPVRDPFGAVAGVLDVSGAAEDRSPLVRLALDATVTSIEQEMRSRAYAAATPGGYRVIERMLQRCNVGALLVEAPGVVRQWNAIAASAFGLREAVPVPMRRVFGIEWSELKAQAQSTRSAGSVVTPGGTMRLELEPLVDPRGNLLAVVAYVEAVSSPRIAQPCAPIPPPATAASGDAFSPILGSDTDLRSAIEMARRFARSDVPVLILAETGTGKELLANGIHQASGRARGPFVPVNCGALAAGLLESELFGYAAGAFTGARSGGYIGKIGAASGGTLFLDEVAEMSEPLQAAVLRVLEDGSYYRVGENALRRADIRVVCATSRDLPSLVQQGKFRHDLYFRIHGVCVTLPPLRQRADRAELARGLLERLAREDGVRAPTLSEDALAWIEAQPWPGNVRELRTALRHALVMAAGEPELCACHLPERAPLPSDSHIAVGEPPPSSVMRAVPAEPGSLRDVEAGALERALAAANGNMSEAARILGVARSTLYRMIRKRDRRAE